MYKLFFFSSAVFLVNADAATTLSLSFSSTATSNYDPRLLAKLTNTLASSRLVNF